MNMVDRRAHGCYRVLRESLRSVMIALDGSGAIFEWNPAAVQALGCAGQALGARLVDLPIVWDLTRIEAAMEASRRSGGGVGINDFHITCADGQDARFVVTVTPMSDDDGTFAGWLLLADDTTERDLALVHLASSQKAASLGDLASGIVHEINTPIQFVGDNLRFLDETFASLGVLMAKYRALISTLDPRAPECEAVATAECDADIDFLIEEAPTALRDALEGIRRVAEIVAAIKEFAHPASKERVPTDLNRALQTTITVARNEWKYVADLVTEFCPTLPAVPCLPGELNQAVLNLIVNAAHAIAERTEKSGSNERGTIHVRSRHEADWAVIEVSDTGNGIPAAIRDRIFERFFTTKAAGKGTGQGLAILHSTVVDAHHGTVTLESEEGRGTTFTLRIPLRIDVEVPATAVG